ncbi:hypothetical protein ANCCAN_23116 [Ancylostoma caninum]|uniref:Uncharacterized protein n=1 Tax=Ancylostoma caninum TaxID=29170 RepID=A0A368FG20_ANCCA|nr:hypothetical protein ANCCAN_23116 [Ancylostoma caninum]
MSKSLGVAHFSVQVIVGKKLRLCRCFTSKAQHLTVVATVDRLEDVVEPLADSYAPKRTANISKEVSSTSEKRFVKGSCLPAL